LLAPENSGHARQPLNPAPARLASRVLSKLTRMRSLRSVIVFVVLCIVWPAAAHAEDLDLGEPEAPPVRTVVERGESPLYYRLPPDVVAVAARSSLGLAMRDGDGAFALSTLAGASIRFGRGASAGLWTEAGYAYERFHEHLFLLGAGPSLHGSGDLTYGFQLVPHAVIGRVDGATGYGIRTSAIASFWAWGIEVAHQLVVVHAQRIQEVQVSMTFPVVFGR
jgi:hypothetical protein